MAKGLKELRQQLRSERCPQQVLERVHAHIASTRRSHRLTQIRWAMATLAVFGIASAMIIHRSNERQQLAHAQVAEAEAVRQQASGALALLGHQVKEAGEHSGMIILKSSLPSLRKGLRTAKDSIARPKPNENEPN